MTTLRKAAQQALEALEFYEHRGIDWCYADKEAITALRAALSEPEPRNQCGETCERAKLCATCARDIEKPEQEPEQNTVTCVCGAVWEGNLMVHAPRQRKPLTEPELHEINPTWPAPGQHWEYEDVLEFVRAIERAHGIGGEA